jgi:hypothetical protein
VDREINLLDYLPPNLQELAEFKALCAAETAECNLMASAHQNLFSDQFIETATENGLSRLEKIMGIVPKGTDTLDARRFRLLARKNEKLPYTFRTLTQKMALLCGGYNFELVPHFDVFRMGVITYLELPGQVNELARLLERFVPCNLVIDYSNEIHCTTYGNSVVAAGMASCEIVDLSDSCKAEFNITGDSIIAGGYSDRVEIIMSDNYVENITVNGNSIAGSGVAITSDIGII